MIDERTLAQPKVTVYSTPTCPYCTMAKRYLSERGVEYDDVNVAEDQSRALEMLTKSGQMGVPVLDIGGQVIVGFNRPAIDDALANQR